MKYYYLLDTLNSNLKPGVYGRRVPTEEEKKDLTIKGFLSIFDSNNLRNIQYDWKNILVQPNIYSTGLDLIIKGLTNLQKLNNHRPLSLVKETNKRCIIIPRTLLDENFRINDEGAIMHGALDKFSGKDIIFSILMKSNVNTTFIIAEKKDINKKHYGGEHGIFETGLYCEHPKDTNILIPLEKVNDLIKVLILEEIINVYEALGAKRIEINDIVEISSEQNGGGILKGSKIKVDVNQKYQKKNLRKKVYGKGTFDPERAKRNKKFIYDLPNIMTTIDGRINGNQILESFSETIDLSGGINIEVLNLFNIGTNFNYQKTWQFEVEFYDKSDL